MTVAPKRDLFLRAPNNRVHRLPASSEVAVLQSDTLNHVHGQWLVYSDTPRSRIAGIYRSSRMESVAGTLLFSVDMTDTGEEFAVILHGAGVTVLCIQLSPSKCPITAYHQYLKSYCRLVGVPGPGDRSVAGGESVDGRAPTPEEFTFRFIHRALDLVNCAGLVKVDLSRHERGPGGESGIDARKTLEIWKSCPEWYSSSLSSGDEEAIRVGPYSVRPLRAVRRESIGTNMFTGAASTALYSLAGDIAHGAVGSMAALLLADAAKRLRSLDTPTMLSFSDAWDYLEFASLPPRSAVLARKLVDFRESLKSISAHIPSYGGVTPFLLPPPELVFQEFVTAKCLLALGVTRENLSNSMREAHSEAGCRFGTFTVWADTPHHSLEGWRDGTAKPAGYEPDLIVVDTLSGKTLLLDAKFRRDESGLLPASGIKDIQAYMHEYELPIAVVAVPFGQGDPPSEEVGAKGFMVRGIALSPEIEGEGISQLSILLDKSWNTKLITKRLPI